MKRVTLYLATLLVLLTPFFSIFMPSAKASAADKPNGNFEFYIPPNGSTYLGQLKNAVNPNNGNGYNDPSVALTTVYVKGGIFGNNWEQMQLDTAQSACARTSAYNLISACAGGTAESNNPFGGGGGPFTGGNDNLFVYSMEYSCDLSKNSTDINPPVYDGQTGPNDPNDNVDIKFSVTMSLGDNLFKNGSDAPGSPVVLHWAGFTGIEHYPADISTETRQPDTWSSRQIPPACRPNLEGATDVYSSSTKDDGTNGAVVNQNVNVSSTVPKGAPSPPSGGGLGSGPGTPYAECVASGYNLSWILCPVIDGLAKSGDEIYGHIIQPLLFIEPVNLTGPSTGPGSDPTHTFAIWENFRIYGDIFLIIALLVVVFGESIGGGLIDAYTAKKVLPRLLGAAILINLSIYIVALGVDITNILGAGLGNLLEAPFKDVSGGFVLHLKGGTSDAGVGLVVLFGLLIAKAHIAAAVAEMLLLFVLLLALLIILAILVTVVLRKGLILILIVSSPVAFALYCLPNTEKYFRRWWDLFLRTLFVYPIIAVLFAMGNIMSVTMSSGTNGALGDLAGFLAIFALFIPLLMIPYSFRIAGGLLGRFHEFATNSAKKSHEAIKGNPNDQWSWRNRSKLKVGAGLNSYQQRLIDRGNQLTATRRHSIIGSVAGSGVFGNPSWRGARYNKMLNEAEESMSSTGRDALRYAAAGYSIKAGQEDINGKTADHDRYFNSKGDEITQAAYGQAKRFFGFTPHGIGSSLEYTYRKAQNSKDLANARFAFAQNAMEHDWTEDEMGDVWAQATFAHKDKHLSEWHSTPVPLVEGGTARDGVRFKDVSEDDEQLDKLIDEGHSTRAQFQWSSVRAQDWHAMGRRMKGIEGVIDSVNSGGATLGSAEDVAAGRADMSHGQYDDHLRRYAKMSELVDGIARQGGATMTDDGDVQVAGASAEVQGVLTAMSKNRKYGVTNAVNADDSFDEINRALYDKEAAKTPELDQRGVATGRMRSRRAGELDEWIRNPAHVVAIAPDVSPNRDALTTRTVIPNQNP